MIDFLYRKCAAHAFDIVSTLDEKKGRFMEKKETLIKRSKLVTTEPEVVLCLTCCLRLKYVF